MLTAKDIKKLTEYQLEVFKDVFATKEELNEKFFRLQTSIDGLSKQVLDVNKEMPVVSHRVKNLESWVGKASPKLGIKFQH